MKITWYIPILCMTLGATTANAQIQAARLQQYISF